jgi:hypothetical protein
MFNKKCLRNEKSWVIYEDNDNNVFGYFNTYGLLIVGINYIRGHVVDEKKDYKWIKIHNAIDVWKVEYCKG